MSNTTTSPFDIIYILILIIWSILCLILFFKIWGMTNDVRAIKEHLIGDSSFTDFSINENEDKENVDVNTKKEHINVGDKVSHPTFKSAKDMYVGKINHDGSCLCVDNKGEAIATLSINNLTKI